MAQDEHFLPGENRQQFLKRVNAGKYGPPSPPPTPPRGMATGPKAGESISRSDIYKGAASEGSMLRANEKKPIINMRVGMGNSDGYNRANSTPVGEAAHKLLGYAYDLIKKGRSFDEARKLMQGTEQFRGLSEGGKDYALRNFDLWRGGQSRGQQNEMGSIRRASQNKVKPTDNLQMRATDSSTANLARTANRVGVLD